MLFNIAVINVVHIYALEGLIESKGFPEYYWDEKERSRNALGIGEGTENLELNDLFKFEVA